MALDRPLNTSDVMQYQLGRGKARYNGARPSVENLVIGSLQWWFNEGVKDVFAGVASRTGGETIFYDENGAPLTPTFGTGGRPVTRQAPPATRTAPTYQGRGTAGSVYVGAPSPGSPNDNYTSTVIGPDSATMAVGPHGEVLTDLLPLFLLLSQSGRGQSSPPPPYYGGYPPPAPNYGGYPQDFPPYGGPYQDFPPYGRRY